MSFHDFIAGLSLTFEKNQLDCNGCWNSSPLFTIRLVPPIVIVSSISTFALPLVLLPLSIVPLFESVSLTYQPSLRRRSTQ